MSNTNIQSEVLPSSASPNEAKSSYDPPMSASDLQRLLSLDDLQDAARKYLDKALYEYFASGTEDEQTLSLNRLAFKQILLKPRVMRNVSTLDTFCFVLGSQRRARLSIFVSPAGVHSLCDGGVLVVGNSQQRKLLVRHRLPWNRRNMRQNLSRLLLKRG